MSSRRAAITLGTVVFLSSLTVWGVHYQQESEREAMYQGVLKDDARRREKMLQRQLDFEESKKKREIYERAQSIDPRSLE
ncbi:hypothetical protein BD626DRAFT_411335 [Schizophyllum amplum]|uniref:Cytochrome c oxidase assembly protein n=1 Tax=Schizophyllum amplum TaxID=97359 RepID=A0A550BZF9_9AGAR|nr:hypothetical protein BD626DRAFT_411335 [Auriculariopsis ampla]